MRLECLRLCLALPSAPHSKSGGSSCFNLQCEHGKSYVYAAFSIQVVKQARYHVRMKGRVGVRKALSAIVQFHESVLRFSQPQARHQAMLFDF